MTLFAFDVGVPSLGSLEMMGATPSILVVIWSALTEIFSSPSLGTVLGISWSLEGPLFAESGDKASFVATALASDKLEVPRNGAVPVAPLVPAILRPLGASVIGRSLGRPRRSSSTKSLGGKVDDSVRGEGVAVAARSPAFLSLDRSKPFSWSTRSPICGSEVALIDGHGAGGGGGGGDDKTGRGDGRVLRITADAGVAGDAWVGVVKAAAADNIFEMSKVCARLACTRSATALSCNAC
eukprot:scaffold239693_cov28-Tisochrysis_lutea.AAC.3